MSENQANGDRLMVKEECLGRQSKVASFPEHSLHRMLNYFGL